MPQSIFCPAPQLILIPTKVKPTELSTIDHILSPSHLISRFSSCYIAEEDPLKPL